MQSWMLALWSVAGSMMPLLSLACARCGRTAEKEAVGLLRVDVSIVPACPIGKAINSILPQYFLRASMRGEYLSVYFASLMSLPKSLQKPISIMATAHCFLVKEVGSEEEKSGTPQA